MSAGVAEGSAAAAEASTGAAGAVSQTLQTPTTPVRPLTPTPPLAEVAQAASGSVPAGDAPPRVPAGAEQGAGNEDRAARASPSANREHEHGRDDIRSEGEPLSRGANSTISNLAIYVAPDPSEAAAALAEDAVAPVADEVAPALVQGSEGGSAGASNVAPTGVPGARETLDPRLARDGYEVTPSLQGQSVVMTSTKRGAPEDRTNEAKRPKADGTAAPDAFAVHQLLEKLGHEFEQVKRVAAAQEAQAAATARELKRLQADAESLRAMTGADLAQLGEQLVEAMGRVQREQRWKCAQQLDERLCRVCLVERKNVVVQPCNHCAMCMGCFKKCNSKCPQCRASISGHLQVYL